MSSNLKKRAKNFIIYRTPIFKALTNIKSVSHFKKYSFTESSINHDSEQLKYHLIKDYHIIEKGLALPEPRYGFGQPKIVKTIERANQYKQKFGNDYLIDSIKKTLVEYLNFHKNADFQLPAGFEKTITDFIESGPEGKEGGLKNISKATSTPLTLEQYRNFAKSRVSVRNFSSDTIPDDLIYNAVDVAKSAPSVCNRQGWRVHSYSNESRIQELLSYQNGNLGFNQVINKLLIITADTKAFTSYEDNQMYTDAGLFTMTLLLAIHAAGLGACCLNTCCPYFVEEKIKEVGSIPSHERVIMMIAVGTLKESYQVAYSTRNPTTEILIQH